MQFCECASSKSVLDFSSYSKITSHKLSWSALTKYCWAGPPEAEWVNEHGDVKAQICMPVLTSRWLEVTSSSCVLFLALTDLKCYLPSFCVVFNTLVL